VKIFIIVLLGIVSPHLSAETIKDCQELKAEQIRLTLIASNLANLNTTRTPDGGTYKPFKIISCANGNCITERIDTPILKYLPNHPDADKNGYVAYPLINQQLEYATFNMTALKLKLLASVNLCSAKMIADNGSPSFSIRYDVTQDTTAKEDVFNFNSHHQVVSWLREDLNGATSVVNFTAKGHVVSNSQSDQ
jgi:hypothetical protein